MNSKVKIYQRNLPHIHPKNGIFFITFRLAGTLPKQVLKTLLEEREKRLLEIDKNLSKKDIIIEKYKVEKRFFAGYDKWLDTCKTGPLWLQQPEVANVVATKLHELANSKYELITYCIMPNHVHLLIKLFEDNVKKKIFHTGRTGNYPLADVMRVLKGSTSRICNLVLQRAGQFWHHESYDHFVRDETEFYRIIKYIFFNPVKAGFVKNYQDWEFSFVKKSIPI